MSIFSLSLNDNLKTLNSLKEDKDLLYKIAKKIIFYCKKKIAKFWFAGTEEVEPMLIILLLN